MRAPPGSPWPDDRGGVGRHRGHAEHEHARPTPFPVHRTIPHQPPSPPGLSRERSGPVLRRPAVSAPAPGPVAPIRPSPGRPSSPPCHRGTRPCKDTPSFRLRRRVTPRAARVTCPGTPSAGGQACRSETMNPRSLRSCTEGRPAPSGRPACGQAVCSVSPYRFNISLIGWCQVSPPPLQLPQPPEVTPCA